MNSIQITATQTNMIWSCLDDYSSGAAQMRTTTDPYPASTESLATTGQGELERLRYQIQQIHGRDYWYQDPTPLNPPGDVRLGVASTRSGLLQFAHGSSAFLTTFQAGQNTAAADYLWPLAGPTADGQALLATTTGNMSWNTLSVANRGTGATSFTADGVLYGAGTGALLATAQGGANTVLTANAGVPSFSNAPILNTAVQVGVVSSVTGSVRMAHATSALLTTFQAGNNTEGNIYVWPADGGASGQVLQTDGATPTTTLSWLTLAIATAASQAEMETASSTTVAVTPGRAQYHPSAAKAWGRWDNAGSISASYNITSITDGGIGEHTVNLTVAFSSAAAPGAVAGSAAIIFAIATYPTAGTILVQGRDTASAAADLGTWSLVAYGDQ